MMKCCCLSTLFPPIATFNINYIKTTLNFLLSFANSKLILELGTLCYLFSWALHYFCEYLHGSLLLDIQFIPSSLLVLAQRLHPWKTYSKYLFKNRFFLQSLAFLMQQLPLSEIILVFVPCSFSSRSM